MSDEDFIAKFRELEEIAGRDLSKGPDLMRQAEDRRPRLPLWRKIWNFVRGNRGKISVVAAGFIVATVLRPVLANLRKSRSR